MQTENISQIRLRRDGESFKFNMIPLYKPYMPPLPELKEILYSGQLSYGSYTRRFEDSLKQYFDEQYLLVTNSFHTAVSVALGVLGLLPGDEVIASPMACLASTQPYQSSGMKVCWADINNRTGTLNPDSVKKSVTGKTKAIVHNHFCGYPGYIQEINDIGRAYGIPVIDDGIECFGAEYRGKKIGHCGTDVTVFSMNPVRIPNCIDGGIVIFREKSMYDKAVLVRDCGIDRAGFRDAMGEINPECDITVTGYSATMSNINGYIGCCQMGHVTELIHRQRKNAEKWDKRMEGAAGLTPVTVHAESKPNYWVYGVLSNHKRDDMISFREKGFYASGVHTLNSFYSVFGKQNTDLPGAEDFYHKFLALPCGWWISDDCMQD